MITGNDKGINQPNKNESPIEKKEIKKIVAKPVQGPTRFFFSSF